MKPTIQEKYPLLFPEVRQKEKPKVWWMGHQTISKAKITKGIGVVRTIRRTSSKKSHSR